MAIELSKVCKILESGSENLIEVSDMDTVWQNGILYYSFVDVHNEEKVLLRADLVYKFILE